MADSLEFPALYVEGDDDLHTIIHLLHRHNVALDKELGPVLVKKAQGDQGVLNAITTATKASTNRSVGFVVDANGAVADRWQAVGDRLVEIGLTLPSAIPLDGFIGDSPTFKARVGVWIMPDNVTDEGKLEHLVETLVPTGDALFGHAKTTTDQAVALGARFPVKDRTKAELHCWLAWQEEPGRPFGTAIKAHFFRHDSEVALRFASWFRKLFPTVSMAEHDE
ncbi:MAG TPA: DUF3226 domain-containing protein [Phycisphaerae bacterium]|nr:DUF3226 domain-containing protein [Phycisphaerae bacterium]